MKLRKRYLIFPAIMVALLVGTIYFALNVQEDQAAEIVTAKMPDRTAATMKYPYSVEQAMKENAAEPRPESRNEDTKKSVTATIEPTPTPEPTPVQTEENDEVDVLDDEIAENPQIEDINGEISNLSEPEALVSEPITEEIVIVEEIAPSAEVVEEVSYSEDYYEEELPPPAETFESSGEYIGTYSVTWYSREAVGYDAPGASGNGLIPYYSCAMPDYGLLGCTILVEGYGYYHVDDISPDGICDLYVMYNSDIPAYGMDTANVYIVG